MNESPLLKWLPLFKQTSKNSEIRDIISIFLHFLPIAQITVLCSLCSFYPSAQECTSAESAKDTSFPEICWLACRCSVFSEGKSPSPPFFPEQSCSLNNLKYFIVNNSLCFLDACLFFLYFFKKNLQVE